MYINTTIAPFKSLCININEMVKTFLRVKNILYGFTQTAYSIYVYSDITPPDRHN